MKWHSYTGIILFQIQANSDNFKKTRQKFHGIVKKSEEKLFQNIGMVRNQPALKHSIGDIQLAATLRIIVEDDDTGKHISCLEFPMLYGFGEDESEAMEMLDREIISLCQDVERFGDLPDEYRYASMLANMVMKNA